MLLSSLSDEELVIQAQTGDADSFNELVKRYQGTVYGLAYRFVRNFADAEDLSQEVFITAYYRLRQVRHPSRFATWLRIITINHCRMWLRKQRKMVPLTEIKNLSVPSPQELIEQYEQEIAVRQAIDSLPESQRLIVTMHYLGNSSYREIGTFLGLSETAIQGRLQRARQKLKERLMQMMPDIRPFRVGKVRDIYDLDDRLLFIATDRISAFDVVLPTGIPYKGKVLNSLSAFWFDLTKNIIDNHLITVDAREYPDKLDPYKDMLAGRSMIVKKAKRIDLECVVRAYLSGSAWKAYKEKGEICGIKLPAGLKESDKLPEPIFTPTSKVDSGHDMELTYAEAEKLVGKNIFDEVKEKSLQILVAAGKKAESKGIIIADTKFEFGIYNGKVILIDEVLTPDSSRFWPMDDYKPGRSQKSFDKQYVRDYLEEIKWDKSPPAPELPDDVVKRTTEKYLEAYKRLTGCKSFI